MLVVYVVRLAGSCAAEEGRVEVGRCHEMAADTRARMEMHAEAAAAMQAVEEADAQQMAVEASEQPLPTQLGMAVLDSGCKANDLVARWDEKRKGPSATLGRSELAKRLAQEFGVQAQGPELDELYDYLLASSKQDAAGELGLKRGVQAIFELASSVAEETKGSAARLHSLRAAARKQQAALQTVEAQFRAKYEDADFEQKLAKAMSLSGFVANMAKRSKQAMASVRRKSKAYFHNGSGALVDEDEDGDGALNA